MRRLASAAFQPPADQSQISHRIDRENVLITQFTDPGAVHEKPGAEESIRVFESTDLVVKLASVLPNIY